MKSEEALRAMEDQQIFNNIHDTGLSRARAATAHDEATIMEAASIKIRAQRDQLIELNTKLAALTQQNNEAVAIGTSAALALKDAVTEIAALKSLPFEEAVRPISVNRTRHFNTTVNQFLQQGTLKKDPRISGNLKNSPWFVPGLDEEHGV